MGHGALLIVAMGALLYIASWAVTVTATVDDDAAPSLNSQSQEERVGVTEPSRPFRARTVFGVADWASANARFAPRPNM